MYTVIFKSGHALEQYPKINLGLGKVLGGCKIYPAYNGNSQLIITEREN